jgi:concanavalin A-like lectin/glucanase superfamily protein
VRIANPVVPVFLLHGEAGFADVMGHTLSSSTGVSTTPGTFGNAALVAGGDNGLIYAASTDWDFGSGDFTVEFTANVTAMGRQMIIGAFGAGMSGARWTIDVWDMGFYIYRVGNTPDDFLIWTPDLALNTPHRICFQRRGTELCSYVGGVKQAMTATITGTFGPTGATTALGVGGQAVRNTGFPRSLNGWLDEVRIHKGHALYTGNYTPAAAAFPNP